MPEVVHHERLAAWKQALEARILAHAAQAPGDLAPIETLLAQREFLRQTLADAATLAETRDGAAFLQWLLGNRQALEDYLEITLMVDTPASRLNGLQAWAHIWKEAPESREGLWQRVAAALAVVFAKKRMNHEEIWGTKISREIDPVARYRFFRTSYERGLLVPYFSQAPAWELAFVVHADLRSIEELLWAQAMTAPDQRNHHEAANMAYSPIRYRLYNYRSQYIHSGVYFDGKPPEIFRMADYGAVCGGISHNGATLATVHGVPAFTIGQPNHMAYVYKSSPTAWVGGNFASGGWPLSWRSWPLRFWASGHSINIRLLTRAFLHPGFRTGVNRMRLAHVYADTGETGAALAALEAACRECPLLWPARSEQIALLRKTNLTAEEWIRLAVTVTTEYAEFPMAADSLRQQCEPHLKKLSPEEQAGVLAQVARAMTRLPSHKQAGLDAVAFAATLSRQIARYGPNGKDVQLLVENAVYPHKNPKKTVPATIEGIKQPEQLVRYLNALAPAANLRGNYAKAVEAAVAACPEEIRSQVQLNLAPPPEPPRPVYKAKQFARIGRVDGNAISAAPVVTQGWRELEFPVPAVSPRNNRLVIVAVHREGGTATLGDLRLYADGEEVDADTTTYSLKNKRRGTFVVTLDEEVAARAKQLTVRVLVADDSPTAPVVELSIPKDSLRNAQSSEAPPPRPPKASAAQTENPSRPGKA